MIPVNEPLLGSREKELLMQCVESGWISSEGPFILEFERRFGDFLGLPPGVAVANGTAALETALYGLGVERGDEVIMPSFTIISCAIAAIRLGAIPVLVDIDPETWCMDTEQVKSKITKKTKVVMPVHIYGHPVNMDHLLDLSAKHSFKILEDAAEVHGAEYFSEIHGSMWIKCGAIGDASAFSFYANKIITTGEGGMVLSSDGNVLERARSYRNLCFRKERRFYHTEIGYNFRMTNMQAAIGVAQMDRIHELVQRKREFGEYYRKKLSSLPGLRFQVEKAWARSVYWMYSIELDEALGIDAYFVMERLREEGIGTRPFFLGLHRQPALRDMGLFHGEKFPRTDRASKYGLYLPSGLSLEEKQIDEVVEKLEKVLRGGRR